MLFYYSYRPHARSNYKFRSLAAVRLLIFCQDILVKTQRPINLNLFKFHFPIPAIVSILHRISGVILFLLLPLLLGLLSSSLVSADSFSALSDSMACPILKFFTWVILSALLFHVFAGIRHLLMDAGIGETLQISRITSFAVIVLSLVGIILLGVWLW